jgi:pimeloyl-ACP methyl ester carboxylesterase
VTHPSTRGAHMPTSPITPDRGGAFVHANGIDIHYVEEGSGEPLVLLHGGLISTGPVWDDAPVAYNPQLRHLAESFRVIAPDTRGGGATVHKDGVPSAALLADDVAALIDALGLERPMIGGFSEGGLTATLVAIRHPEAVRAVVNDAGFDLLAPDSPMFEQARMLLGGSPEATVADPDAAAGNFAQMGMGEMFEMIKADHDQAQGEGYWRTYLELTFQRWTRPPGYTFDDLRGIAVPTLVLTGDRDDFCSMDDAVTAYRSLPRGELAVVPDHDHHIGPAKVEASLEFLRRHAED